MNRLKKSITLRVVIFIITFIFLWDYLFFPDLALVAETKEFGLDTGKVRTSLSAFGVLIYSKEESTILSRWLEEGGDFSGDLESNWQIIGRKGVVSGYSPQFVFSRIGRPLIELEDGSLMSELSSVEKGEYARRLLNHWKTTGRPESIKVFDLEK